MCQICAQAGGAIHTHATPGRSALKNLSPRERQLIEELVDEFAAMLERPHGDLVQLLEERSIDLTSIQRIRTRVDEAFADHAQQFDAVVETMHQDGHDVGRETAIQRHQLEISTDLTRQEVRDVLEQRALEMSQATRERMIGDLTEALADAHQQGLSIPDITQTLQDEVFEDMRSWEAERVARTNVISGSNKGANEAYRDAGAPAKEWVATQGPRTRESHRIADGQVVLMEDTFTVGGHSAEHPGDPSLPLDELVNCRCTLVPVYDLEQVGA